jgi:D-alanine-D-alanine ligase-like ATP-grasp enzyme
MKTEDWKTEANVLAALNTLGHPTEHLAIFDNLDFVRQKLESFGPDVIFNLADQFKNNRGFDQNIASLLEMQGVPFTGCGATGLVLCKHKGISKKILQLSSHPRPNFVVLPRATGGAAAAAQIPASGQAGERRGFLRHCAGFLRRSDDQFQRARHFHSREPRQRRDC